MEQVKFSAQCKKLMQKSLSDNFKKYPNFIVTNYFGLTGNDMNAFRKDMKNSSSKYMVVKNSIARLVFEELGISEAGEQIDGGVGIGFISGDAAETTKVVCGFAKKKDKLQVRGGYIDGKLLDTDEIKYLASLPSREVLLTMLVTSMKSPISGFVNILGGVLKSFMYALNALKEKKEKESK